MSKYTLKKLTEVIKRSQAAHTHTHRTIIKYKCVSWFSSGGPLARTTRITWRTLSRSALHDLHSTTVASQTGTPFSSRELVNYTNHSQWPLPENWTLTCDPWLSWLPHASLPAPLGLPVLDSSRLLILFTSRVWILAHAVLHCAVSAQSHLLTLTVLTIINDTDISQTCPAALTRSYPTQQSSEQLHLDIPQTPKLDILHTTNLPSGPNMVFIATQLS